LPHFYLQNFRPSKFSSAEVEDEKAKRNGKTFLAGKEETKAKSQQQFTSGRNFD